MDDEGKRVDDLLLDRLSELAKDQTTAAKNSTTILLLAEAYAWVLVPGQPHGSRIATTVQR